MQVSDRKLTRISKDLSVEAYDQICRDIRDQPKWRLDSDKDASYYDGAQMDQDVIERLEKAGIPAQDSNFIKPTLNAVLGMEAQSRTDYKITSDDESQDEIAEGLSAKIKEIESESRADRAMSDAYSSMMRTGIGWIEVGREINPFGYPYRVREIHRNEIYWDWSAKEPDLSDARYLRRDRWLDCEEAISMFPKESDIISNSWNGWNTVDVYDGDDTRLARAYEVEQTWGMQRDDWLNRQSGMVKLSELWYRFHESTYVLYLPNGKAIEYIEDNPYHQQAIARGIVQVQKARIPRVRMSVWLGPHKLMDVPTPLPHGNFPYIPFWCFRKDKSRTPYGLIRDMRGPQDQIIDLDILLYEILNSVKLTVDNDALDLTQNTYQEVAQNMTSLRSMTVLNSQRRNSDGFKMTREHELAGQVYQLVQERKMRIESVSGVYRAMLGQGTEADSGVAINNLVQQGSTVLAEPNDNFRYARRLCGQQLLAFAIADMVGKPTQVAVKQGAKQKLVYFNREVMTPNGPVVENDIATAQVKVVLEDIPATPTFRAQQLQALSQMVQAAPPAYQAVLYPVMFELSDVPNRHAIADQMRKVGGVRGAQTPEQEKQEENDNIKAKAIQEQMIALELQLKQALVLKTQAEAKRAEAQAMSAGGDGGEAMNLKMQAMEQQLQAEQQINALNSKINQLQLALANKAGELDLKERELDIKEQQGNAGNRIKAEQVVLGHIAANKPAPQPARKSA